MWLFGPKRMRCPARVWTTIIDDQFVQMPRGYTLRFEASGATLVGTLEEKKSTWIFPGAPRAVPLTPEMTLDRGYFNTFYRVRVRPEHDVDVVIE